MSLLLEIAPKDNRIVSCLVIKIHHDSGKRCYCTQEVPYGSL